MACAIGSQLADGESMTTLELKINFLKPVWNSHLRAEAKVVKAGQSVGLASCDVYDETGSLVAHATSTCMVLRGYRGRVAAPHSGPARGDRQPGSTRAGLGSTAAGGKLETDFKVI